MTDIAFSESSAGPGLRPLNILCLDGGGLSLLLIPRGIMEEVHTATGSSTRPRSCEISNFLCGTSTSGLIALMLGRLRMDIDDVIHVYIACVYIQLSKDISGKRD